jgi:uroporphyrinogen decarboxylase
LIGFAGAPWTIASYMIAGRGSPDQMAARLFAYRYPAEFGMLIELLVASITEHLVRQIHAGAEIVQIFDSWAGVLPFSEFDKWCLAPLERIVRGVRTRCPDTPIIAFPRACSNKALAAVADVQGVAGVSIDTSGDLEWACRSLPTTTATQGNLDPIQLLAGGAGLEQSIDRILSTTAGRPHIFNLGHGILPPTPIAHVERLIERIRR